MAILRNYIFRKIKSPLYKCKVLVRIHVNVHCVWIGSPQLPLNILLTLAAEQVYSGWAGQILHTAKADQWPIPQEPQGSSGSVPRGVPVVWKREEESSSW